MDRLTVSERLVVSLRALGSIGHRWLDDLPDLLASLEVDWSITCGTPLDGGNAAYVTEATTFEGLPVVLKVALPPGVDGFSPFEQQLDTLRLARGDPYVELLRHDVSRRSMLLERLGKPLASLGWSTTQQLTAVASTVTRGWRPVTTDRLPTGAAKARWLRDFVAAEWEDLGRPCSEAAAERAVNYAAERAACFNPDRAVLIHGDAHAHNLLQVPGSADDDSTRFKLIDPEGLLSEPAHDLGVSLRAWNEGLLAQNTAGMAIQRCQHVTLLTGVDPEAVWQWAFTERVSTGLFLLRLDHHREARTYLEVADRLAEVVPPWA